MSDRYILEGHAPVREPDLKKWATWFEDSGNRLLGSTTIGTTRVSTVFLGLDHSFGQDGPPILFETMIFGGDHDGFQERYMTWVEAVAGHARAVAMLKGETP